MRSRCLLKWRSLLLRFIISIGFAVGTNAQVEADSRGGCGPPSASTTYEWELYDYYKVLDLPEPKQGETSRQRRKLREKIDTKDIRKAYRRQAQLHHPDKANSRNTTSTEESNARFARIAEAYEILSNEEKRHQYNEWLIECESRRLNGNHGTTTPDRHNGVPWSVFDSFSDPRTVFENFFTSKSGDWDDMMGNYRSRNHNQPVRVHERQETFVDPYSGRQVVRVYQTEEYAPGRDGSFFYRIYVQDFMEKFDQFFGWEYDPISSPTVLEEGYKETHHDRANADILAEYEVITVDSKPLVSENGRFYAGLGPQCELVVISEPANPDFEENFVVWSSESYIPMASANCFLTLQGPYLLLATGTPDSPGHILWSSDVPETFLEMDESGAAEIFFATLDNDGSLSVYLQKAMVHSSTENHGDKESVVGPASKTRSAIAWQSLKRWVARKISSSKGHEEVHSSAQTEPTIVCIFATGPAGCNFHARKLLTFGYGLRDSFKKTVRAIDSMFDSFLEFFLDDSEDIVDKIIGLAGKTTNTIAKTGSTVARRGAKLFQDAYAKIRQNH